MVATVMQADASLLVDILVSNLSAMRLTAIDLTGVLMVTTAPENRVR